MLFRATIMHGYVRRSVEIDAPNAAAARQRAERMCEPGEVVQTGEAAVMLLSRVTVEANPVMPADHARNVATGRRS